MKKKRNGYQEKPRMCDPGMCDHCTYVGEGDFICDHPVVIGNDPEMPVAFVVENWQPNENCMKCKRGGQGHGR